MIAKPKYTISKFNGMNNAGGTFYVDGFNIENENGVLSLDESYTAVEVVNSSTTNFTDMGNIKAKIYLYSLTGSTINANTAYTLMFDGSNFFTTDSKASSAYSGKIGGLGTSGTYKYTEKPDLFQLPSGNILFTSSRHLGLIVRGLTKTASTTKIVDNGGRNLSALGLSSSAPNNKVVNLRTGAEYTISSISTTNSTNDTLNFSAGTTNLENDEFVAFVYTYKDFNYVNGTDSTAVTIPNFAGQQVREYWARPIQLYGTQYMIGNGNYIAILANDEATIDTTYKALPSGHQLIDFKVNSFDSILVSSVDNQGRGHLLLWDGSSDGWQQILDLDSAPTAIKGSGSGWIYLLDGVIYYTDGLNIDPMITWPETSRKSAYNTTNFNGITSYNGVYYFCVAGSGLADRSSSGVLVFNPKSGLSLFKTKSNGVSFKTPYCIDVKTEANISATYSTNSIIEVAGQGFYNQITLNTSSTDTKDNKSIIYLSDLGQETQITEVWLNLKRSTKSTQTTRTNKNTTIVINYGNGSYPVYSYGKANITTTTAVANVNGDIYPGVVGQEIEFISGNVAGQRTYISSIANAGTVNETWVIDAVSTTGDDCEYRALGVKKSESKTITLDELSKPVRFPVNFFGDKLWLEIVIKGTANSFPVSINSIMIF
jgi:hypothetical protein